MSADTTTAMRWRVLTWNILGARDPDLGEIASEVAVSAPDIAAFQEIRRSQARTLARHLGWHHVWTRKHYPYSPLVWWRAEGHAVLSPLALTHRCSVTISPGVGTSTYRHRVLLAVTAHRGRTALRVVCTHLSSDDPDARIAQARRVAEFVLDEQRRASNVALDTVVAGDLNTTDDPVPVLREFRTARLVDHGGGPTNPSIAPTQRIDFVLLPDSATDVHTSTSDGGDAWHRLSDHLPVLVEFTAAARQ